MSRFWRIEIQPLILTETSSLQPKQQNSDVFFSRTPRRVYYIRGQMEPAQVQEVSERLLCDPVIEQFRIWQYDLHPETQWSIQPVSNVEVMPSEPGGLLEILPRPGVMDPAAASVQQAANDLGFPIEEVRTGRCYPCRDKSMQPQILHRAFRHLANPLVEEVYCTDAIRPLPHTDPFVRTPLVSQDVATVPLRQLSETELLSMSRTKHLFLSANEMRVIQEYYHTLKRDPTDVELETLAQTWSEHCIHKTFRSPIYYQGEGFPDEIYLGHEIRDARRSPRIQRHYQNLLSDTIKRATNTLKKSWCLSVFEDNAGIIEFDAQHGISFKVETHNHPSALEPYGGSETGIGGVIRDIMGCGLGGKPIANTDVFCFAPPDWPDDRLPENVFAPARTMTEVVRGVRDYGNRMGIPTVGGAIAFDPRYLCNPLVFCGCVGLIPRNRIEKSVHEQDRIVLLGGRTGRDGIHGATFSSAGMTDTHATEFSHAVQIGNAITQKKVLDVLLQARDHPLGCLFRSITDCGAGGLSSAVGEMGRTLGAVVHLDRVPLKYEGLRYDEVWISESQERMVLAVPPENLPALIALCENEDVEISDIGVFGNNRRLTLHYQQGVVGEMDTEFLHEGVPLSARPARWEKAPNIHMNRTEFGELHSALIMQLQQPNIASKEWVIRQYDHEVQGTSVIKPLVGPGHGPSDGAVLRPLLNSDRGVALSCGLSYADSEQDPYVTAIAAVDEAVRNNISIGGNLKHMALLDNFCWGEVNNEDPLGTLVRAAQGCHDAALAYQTPFISGKDSLNNMFDMDVSVANKLNLPPILSIPNTVLISAVSVIENVHQSKTSSLKHPGNVLYLITPKGRRIGHFAESAQAVQHVLAAAACSCHDCSDGGILVAAAEMSIGGQCGLELTIDDEILESLSAHPGTTDQPNDVGSILLSPRLGSYLIEVPEGHALTEITNRKIQVHAIGRVISDQILRLRTAAEPCAEWGLSDLCLAWNSAFRGF